MDPCVVDTDVLSFLFKSDSRSQLYSQHLAGKLLVVSFMTVAELEYGAFKSNWGVPRMRQLEAHIQQFVIYPFDRSMCRVWAQITDSVRRQGRTIHTADAWIAATAVRHSIPLISHNRKDYQAAPGLTLIS